MVDFTENFSQYAVSKLPTFRDDFSGTDNWSDVGTGFGVNISTDVMDITGVKNDANNASGFDLGVGMVSDTNWVLRFKIDLTSLPAITTDDSVFYLSVDSTDQSVGANSTGHDALTLQIAKSATTQDVRWVPFSSDGGTVFETGGTTLFTNEVGPIRYIEIKRTSAISATWTVYSDASFTTILASSTNIILSSITNLRYITFRSRSDVTSGTGEIVGEIDNVEFWNEAQQGDVTFQDDFTVDNFVETGTLNQVNTGTGVLDFDFDRDTTNHKTVRDLISTSDDNWTLRWKQITDVVTQTGTPATLGYIGMISTDNTVPANGTNDFIGLEIVVDDVNNLIRLIDANGSVLSSGTVRYTFTEVNAVNTRYWEVKRLSATQIIASVYSDALFTELIETSGVQTTTSTVSGLQYIGVITDNQATSVSSHNGTLDDMEFYDGVSVAKTPIKELIDFEDNFWEDNWVDAHASSGVNTTTQVIDFTYSTDSQNESVSFDLGANVVNPEKWALRFKMNFTTLTQALNTVMWVGVADSDSSSSSASSHQALWLKPINSTGVQAWHFDPSNETVPNSNTSTILSEEDLVTGKDYYCELKRVSSTVATASVYDDADYTQLRFTRTYTISSSITGLRYIKVMNANLTLIGNMTGTIDNIQFWNGNNPTEHGTQWVEVNLG